MNIPDHIKTVRAGRTIYTRVSDIRDKDVWKPHHFDSIGLAKKHSRVELGCLGGPRTAHRTLKSLQKEGFDL